MNERAGIIVWMNDIKSARGLEKYGTVHYISKKMKYVVMYVNAEKYEYIATSLAKLPFVEQVERSLRTEIKTEYNSNVPDKTRFYSF